METESHQLLPRRLAGHGQFERRRRCHIQHDVGPEISFVVDGIDVIIGGHYALTTSDQLQPSWTQSSGNDIDVALTHFWNFGRVSVGPITFQVGVFFYGLTSVGH